MKVKTNYVDVWAEYQSGIQYKNSVGVFDTVKQNENFYNGKQWEGVRAPDLPKPVFNFIKPAVNYYIAMLISDDIAVNAELLSQSAAEAFADQERFDPFGMNEQVVEDDIPKIISKEIHSIIEHANISFVNRKIIRNCAVDGDACLYVWYDASKEALNKGLGEIKVDLIDNTNVYFGDPSTSEVQTQPYIILAYRKLTSMVKEEAKADGADPDLIVPDDDYYDSSNSNYNDLNYTTVLLKFWKQEDSVYMLKCTQTAIMKKPTDTGYRLYPISYMSWENVKNSYHGISPITAAIPNQIFVNKLYAMAMISVQNSAFPKIVYNRSKIARWDGRPGREVAVQGDPNDAVFNAFRAPDMSGYVTMLIDSTIKYTKDLMGASDAALGNVKPDNTSAIIATQKAAGLPLDIQRLDFYTFVESYIRIFADIMRAKYGQRYVVLDTANEEKRQVLYDFSQLEESLLKLKIDIGQAAYWSELTQVQTLDNLMDRGVIPDALTYLEAIPEGYIKNKSQIIEKIKEQMQLNTDMQQQMAAQEEMTAMQGAEEAVAATQGMQTAQTITEEQINAMVSQLRQMTDEEAAEVIDAMDISEEDKVRILERLKGGEIIQ